MQHKRYIEMSIKFGKKHDAHDVCDTCEEFKGCKAEKTDVWFFQNGKYCSECLESMVMSEALQPECEEEQREFKDMVRRECDHVYSPYDE